MTTETQAPDPAQPKLEDIEQYRMQMAGISTAAIGYWKEGDSIHPDYDTVALRDVARLYAKYDALYKAAAIPAPEGGQLPPLPEPHWPRGYHGAVPSGGYTADQMHAYARAALAAPAPQAAPAWQPIETAPDDTPVVVAWWESDETPHYDFDQKEDGGWQRWHDHAEHVEMIGGHGVSYTAPYTHWMPLPAAPAPTDNNAMGQAGCYPVGEKTNAAPKTTLPNLMPVIAWLENGCDPKEAAKELRIYQAAMAAPAPQPPVALTDEQIDKLLTDLDDAALNFGDDLPGLALNSRGRERSRAIVRSAFGITAPQTKEPTNDR